MVLWCPRKDTVAPRLRFISPFHLSVSSLRRPACATLARPSCGLPAPASSGALVHGIDEGRARSLHWRPERYPFTPGFEGSCELRASSGRNSQDPPGHRPTRAPRSWRRCSARRGKLYTTATRPAVLSPTQRHTRQTLHHRHTAGSRVADAAPRCVIFDMTPWAIARPRRRPCQPRHARPRPHRRSSATAASPLADRALTPSKHRTRSARARDERPPATTPSSALSTAIVSMNPA